MDLILNSHPSVFYGVLSLVLWFMHLVSFFYVTETLNPYGEVICSDTVADSWCMYV